MLHDDSPFKIKNSGVFFIVEIIVIYCQLPINLSIVLGKRSFNTALGVVDSIIFKLVQIFDLLIVHAIYVLLIVIHVCISDTLFSLTFSHFLNLVNLVRLFPQADALISILYLLDDSIKGCVDYF